MKAFLLAACAIAFVPEYCNAQASVDPEVRTQEVDNLKARSEAWAKILETMPFKFPKGQLPNLLRALGDFDEQCELQIVGDPEYGFRTMFTFKVIRDGKELFEIPGHLESDFRTFDGNLYFLQYGTSSSGSKLLAYDLKDGRLLWETENLNRFPPFGHSAYGNGAFMAMPTTGPRDLEDPAKNETILIWGHESFGDYIAVVDRHTGTVMAHRIYRKGFGRSKQPK